MAAASEIEQGRSHRPLCSGYCQPKLVSHLLACCGDCSKVKEGSTWQRHKASPCICLGNS